MKQLRAQRLQREANRNLTIACFFRGEGWQSQGDRAPGAWPAAPMRRCRQHPVAVQARWRAYSMNCAAGRGRLSV
jgi:hypothetical protein